MKKKHAILSLVIVFTIALYLIPSETYAIPGLNAVVNGVRTGAAELLWNVTFVLLNVFLYILQFVGSLFEAVAGVQNFFSDGVNAAWEATRDFANLFFALMLLFIAIATVLGLNQYSAKNMLPKFFMAALFINFSKALVGVLIDISQIIMFEFYNALGGNITNNAVNLSQITYFHNGVPDGLESFEAYMNGVVLNLVMILLIVILIFAFIWGTLTLAIRLVTLWVLISLSPIAFVSMIVPPLGGAFNEWKKSLSEQLVKGPAFMFFIWLAFIVLKATTDTLYTPTNELSGSGIDSSFTTFFTDGGPFIGFTLTAIFLFMANNIAEKAATAAPGVGGKLAGAVGKYGGIATLGIGGYMGLSQVKGPGQAFKTAGQEIVANKGKLAIGAGLATGGLAGAAIGAAAVGGAKAVGSVPAVKHRARYAKESIENNFKEGNLTGGRIGLLDRTARMFSEEAQEKAYQQFKDPREKARTEQPLISGSSDFDPKAYLAYRQAEAAATKDLKEIDDVDALNDKLIKADDMATKRAAFKQLANRKGGMDEENLDKLGKELGVEFKKGASRADKIEQISSQFDFGNQNYASKNMEHRLDVAKTLADEGDYTYNPTAMAAGEDPVYAYLKKKSANKRMGALNKTNLTADGKSDQLNQERFEKIIESFDESELSRDRLYDDIPNRKELREMIDQAYPDQKTMPSKVSIFYNNMTSTSTPKSAAKAQTGVASGTSSNSLSGSVGTVNSSNQRPATNPSTETSVAEVTGENMDDN